MAWQVIMERGRFNPSIGPATGFTTKLETDYFRHLRESLEMLASDSCECDWYDAPSFYFDVHAWLNEKRPVLS